MDTLMGTITLLGTQFAPRGWMRCDGSLLQLEQWQALYSLLGTTYGGDGTTTFALPNLAALESQGGGSVSYYICVMGSFPTRE